MYVWVYELINVLYLNLSWVLLSFQFLLRRTSKYSQKQFQKSLGIGYVHAIYTQTHMWIYTIYILYTWMHAQLTRYAHSQHADTAGGTFMFVYALLLK